MIKKYKIQKGFTLIELLMVVAIIAILASMVLMSLNSGRERAAVNRYISYGTQMYRLVGDSVAAGYFDSSSLSSSVNPGTEYCLGAYTASNPCMTGAINDDLNSALSKLTELPEVTKENAFSPYSPTHGVSVMISSDNSQAIIRMYLLSTDPSYLNKICTGINWQTCNGDSCCTAVSLNTRLRS